MTLPTLVARIQRRRFAAIAGPTIVSDAPFTFRDGAYHALLPVGTTFTLTGQPAPGWRFTNWSGRCSGSVPCTITLSKDLVTDSAIANFERAP